MQATTLFTILTFLLLTLMFMYNNTNTSNTEYDIYKIASQDLSKLNNTRNLSDVMCRYFYQLLVRGYRSNCFDFVSTVIKNWVNNSSAIVKEDLLSAEHDAISNFWSAVDLAEAKKTDVNFKIDESHDYHVLPKSIIYNDLLDMDSLLSILDSKLEVI